MSVDFHQGPKMVHPEEPSALGSRNSLNRDGRDEYTEARQIIDEEVDKILNHVHSKLPPEALQEAKVMGNIKGNLHNYFNQRFQNMLNRYLTTVEDEFGKKVRDTLDKHEHATLNRYTPREIADLVNSIGGSEQFNTGEVEKSMVNIMGHLQGHVQRGMFEVESREIFKHRQRVAKVLELEQGKAVADIGAGTGLFLPFFTKGVGTTGTVYAVEIAPRFIDHLQDLAKKKGWTQVRTVFCTDRSTKLEKGSIDTAFICDTYHHFEYPRSTLQSLHDAMKPGGRLVIVDFERIPGKSRKWILGHVRCGKKTVIEEVESAGFVYEDEVQVRGLRENYVIRFRRK